jgi:hypothetical protein
MKFFSETLQQRLHALLVMDLYMLPLLLFYSAAPLLLQNARNVLVSSNAAAAAGLTAKLADFGLSRAMKQQQTHRTTQTCGTMSHMVSSEAATHCAVDGMWTSTVVATATSDASSNDRSY